MIDTPEDLVSEIVRRAGDCARYMIAIAGPPAAGKSTLTEQLESQLNAQGIGRAVIVPMDGYHLDNGILDELGLRSRKGSPGTFDALGFHSDLLRIKQQTVKDGEDAGQAVYVPVFDRDADLARACAQAVHPEDRFILIEGNYLLLGEEPWSKLHSVFDLTVGLSVPLPVLENRLYGRWIHYGLDPEAACKRAEENDLVNGHHVLQHSVAPMITYRSN